MRSTKVTLVVTGSLALRAGAVLAAAACLVLGSFGQGLYDSTVVREMRLSFSQADFWPQLLATHGSGDYVAADLELDGQVYANVGVQMRGKSTFLCANDRKKPFKIKADHFVAGQKVQGYDSLRLGNDASDPSFLREMLMGDLAAPYATLAKRAYVRLVINGEPWGLYVHTQQKDGTWMEEVFGSSAGHRYKSKTQLNYKGPDPSHYLPFYDLRTPQLPSPWDGLIEVSDWVSHGPLGPGLTEGMRDRFNVDGFLWQVATGALLGNWDGVAGSGNNWYYVEHPLHGRGQIIQHDLNLSFGLFGGGGTPATFPVDYGFGTHPGRPLVGRLLADQQLQKEYYAHCRTLLDDLFRWSVIGPLANQYHERIAPFVLADDKKHYSYAEFVANLTQSLVLSGCWGHCVGIEPFVTERRAFLLGHPEISAERVGLTRLERSPVDPGPADWIQFNVHTEAGLQASAVQLRWRTVGRFVHQAMFDDGLHGDGLAGDGVWGLALPPQPPGSTVEAYAMATADTPLMAVSFVPSRASNAPVRTFVRYAAEGLRLTEYLYSGVVDEFVEITNTSSQSLSLNGWSLDDSSAEPGMIDLSSLGTLAPGASVVVCGEGELAFRLGWGGLPSTRILGGMSLAPLGRADSIYLFDPQGEPRDVLHYGDEVFPGSVRAKDRSATVCWGGLGANQPYAWSSAMVGDGQGSWSSVGGDVASPGQWTAVDCPPGGLGQLYCESPPNSTGLPAELEVHGSLVLGESSMTFVGSQLPANQLAFLLTGDSQAQLPGFGGSQGTLCLAPPLVRFSNDPLSTGAAGEVVLSPDLMKLPSDQSIAPGETWSFQLWYRDGGSSNFSHAVAVEYH